MAFTQDFRTQRRNYNDGQTRIGELGRLWYDSESNTIRVSDGETEGGIVVGGGEGGGSYTLPTASTTVKGGVKVDGTTITITNQVISGFSGSYNDLTDKPTLFSGSYNDLTNRPTIPTNTNQLTNGAGFITSSSLSGYATETYVTTRGYLTDIPEASITVKGGIKIGRGLTKNLDGTVDGFSGSYNDLTDKPTLFSGAYADLSGLPTLFDGAYSSLSGLPTLITSYNDLTDKPTLFSGSYNDLTDTPTLFSGSYNDLTDKPTLFSGSYNDLTDTPAIPTNLTDLGITDGINGQVLTTNGAGGFSFQDAAGGGSSVFSNQYSLTTTTTNSTETELLVGGSTRIPVATNKSVNYIVQIAARRTDTPGDYAFFEIRGIAANNAGTVTDIGSVYEVVVARTNNGYLVDVRADDTNNSVNVYVTGVSGHTIDWRAVVQTVEV